MKITISNIFAFLQGETRKIQDDLFASLPAHIKEQVLERIELVKITSPKCLEGKCVVCSCATPDLFYADKSCEQECYPTMKSKEDWEAYKALYGTQFQKENKEK